MINKELNRNLITLQPLQAEMMRLFNQNPYKYISTFKFRENGICSPAQVVSLLKDKGAIIEKQIGSEIDPSGKWHKRIASYRFRGWK